MTILLLAILALIPVVMVVATIALIGYIMQIEIELRWARQALEAMANYVKAA